MRLLKKGIPNRYVFLTLRTTVNNLFFTVHSRRGSVLLWKSCGSNGFRGPRRTTPLAAEQTARTLGEWLLRFNFRWICLRITCLQNNRIRAALRGLGHFPRLRIRSLNLSAPLAHNGVRPKKLRRI